MLKQTTRDHLLSTAAAQPEEMKPKSNSAWLKFTVLSAIAISLSGLATVGYLSRMDNAVVMNVSSDNSLNRLLVSNTSGMLNLKDLPPMLLSSTGSANTFCALANDPIQIICPAGFYCPTSGPDAFLPCPPSSFCPLGSVIPISCPSDGEYFTESLASKLSDCKLLPPNDFKSQIEQSSPMERDLLTKALNVIPYVGGIISGFTSTFIWPDPLDKNYAEKGLNALHDWTVQYIEQVEATACMQDVKATSDALAILIKNYEALEISDEKRRSLTDIFAGLTEILTKLMDPNSCPLVAQAPYFVSFATTHISYLREVYVNYLVIDTTPINTPQHLRQLQDAIKTYTAFAASIKAQLSTIRSNSIIIENGSQEFWPGLPRFDHCYAFFVKDTYPVAQGGRGDVGPINYCNCDDGYCITTNMQSLKFTGAYTKSNILKDFNNKIAASMVMSEVWPSFDPTSINTDTTRLNVIPCDSAAPLIVSGQSCTGNYQCASKQCNFANPFDLTGVC